MDIIDLKKTMEGAMPPFNQKATMARLSGKSRGTIVNYVNGKIIPENANGLLIAILKSNNIEIFYR